MLQVKNWKKFQHYSERNPPWIKLHLSLFDDYDFHCLQDASKLHLMLIWLYAAKHGGEVPADPAFVARKIDVDTEVDLQTLVNAGFLIDASNELAASKQMCVSETYKQETYKQETEESISSLSGDEPTRDSHSGNGKAERKPERPPKKTPDQDPEFTADFEKIWAIYPRKDGKAQSLRLAFSLYREDGEARLQQLADAVSHYARSRLNEDPSFTMIGPTFFKSRWQDWINGDPKPTFNVNAKPRL